MSDKITDQPAIAKRKHDLNDLFLHGKHDVGLHTDEAGPGAALRSALGQDAVTVVRDQSEQDFLDALAQVLKDLQSIPLPDGAHSEADQKFYDAFQSIVRGAAENSRTDIMSMFADILLLMNQIFGTNRDQRVADFQVYIEQAKVETGKMEQAAEMRKSADNTGGITQIVAGAFQAVCGAVTVGMAAYQITKLPKLGAEVQKYTEKITKQSTEISKCQNDVNDVQKKISGLQKSVNRTPDPTQLGKLDAARNAKASADNLLGAANEKLASLNAKLDKATDQLKKVDAYIKVAGGVEQIGMGFGGGIQGAGRMLSAADTYAASIDDVEAKRAAIKREIHQMNMQYVLDISNHVRDQYFQIMNAGKENQLSNNQTGISMAKNMS